MGCLWKINGIELDDAEVRITPDTFNLSQGFRQDLTAVLNDGERRSGLGKDLPKFNIAFNFMGRGPAKYEQMSALTDQLDSNDVCTLEAPSDLDFYVYKMNKRIAFAPVRWNYDPGKATGKISLAVEAIMEGVWEADGGDFCEAIRGHFEIVASGTTLSSEDSSANGNNLNIVGTPTADNGGGSFGVGASFNGANEAMTRLDSDFNLDGDFSIFIAFKPIPGSGDSETLVGYKDTALPGYPFRISYEDNNKNIGIAHTGPTETFDFVTLDNSVTPNILNVVWITRDAGSLTYRIRVNGGSVQSLVWSGGENPPANRPSGTLVLGGPGVAGSPYRGVLYEVRLWDSIVSDATLNAIANSDPAYVETPEGTEVGCYFLGAPDNMGDDSSGDSRHLTLLGTTTNGSNKDKFDFGLDFDGSTTMAQAQDDAFNITGELTVFVVYEPNLIYNDSFSRQIIGFQTDGGLPGSGTGLRAWQLNHSQTSLSYGTGPVGAGTAVAILDTPRQQYCVILRRDGSGAYFIGVDQSSDGFPYGPNIPSDATGGWLTIGGARASDGSRANLLDGIIREVRIWDTLISSATLAKLIDPEDHTYDNIPVGGEIGFYQFEPNVEYERNDGVNTGNRALVRLPAQQSGSPQAEEPPVGSETSMPPLVGTETDLDGRIWEVYDFSDHLIPSVANIGDAGSYVVRSCQSGDFLDGPVGEDEDAGVVPPISGGEGDSAVGEETVGG